MLVAKTFSMCACSSPKYILYQKFHTLPKNYCEIANILHDRGKLFLKFGILFFQKERHWIVANKFQFLCSLLFQSIHMESVRQSKGKRAHMGMCSFSSSASTALILSCLIFTAQASRENTKLTGRFSAFFRKPYSR